jgi:hypothetical protein
MKLFSFKEKMKPNQEARIGVYCKNKHLLAYVTPTPFSVLSVKARCNICGLEVELNDLEMELEKK